MGTLVPRTPSLLQCPLKTSTHPLSSFTSSPTFLVNNFSKLWSRNVSGVAAAAATSGHNCANPPFANHPARSHQRRNNGTVLLCGSFVRSNFPATSSFHTSVSSQLLGKPKSNKFDLVASEPRLKSEWAFRYVRYGKSEKQWMPKIPMGKPQYDQIPVDHVDRTGEPYTTDPLPWKYTRGRDPVTGRRSNFRIGEGVRRFFRMVDYTRNVPVGENSPFIERVLEIVDDETIAPFIALVANGNFKRYILASENMKVGNLIKTYNEIPRNPVQAFEGDAYPLGALAAKTIVHNIEIFPGQGGKLAVGAGDHATVLRKEGEKVIISVFRRKRTFAIVHNQEYSLDERCMATVGKVSNAQSHKVPIGGPTMKYKLGFRARSGLWQKKDGRYGRRVKPPPEMKIVEPMEKPFTPVYRES